MLLASPGAALKFTYSQRHKYLQISNQIHFKIIQERKKNTHTFKKGPKDIIIRRKTIIILMVIFLTSLVNYFNYTVTEKTFGHFFTFFAILCMYTVYY